MIRYKINVLEELKKSGYNTYILRKKGLLNENAIGKLRKNEIVTMENINAICVMLKNPRRIY